MIEIKRFYLQIRSIEELNKVKKPSKSLKVEKSSNNFQLNKFFYREIGKKHRWVDRLSWSNDTWINYLNNKNLYTCVLKKNDDLVGYYEKIYYEESNEFEIAYFGIMEEYIGKGYGGFLLSEALESCLKEKVSRIWVHTCSLDHENAIKNYLARGMKLYKEEKIKISA